jgi:hypothetical protein
MKDISPLETSQPVLSPARPAHSTLSSSIHDQEDAVAAIGFVAALTCSESYTEILRVRPAPGQPEQFVCCVESRLESARNPEEWHRRHQVIVDRHALLSLREDLNQLLDGTSSAGNAAMGHGLREDDIT